MKAIIFTLFVSLLLTACGQKGALYLPETPTNTIGDNTNPVADDDPNDY